jgi:micrococcal nuclease
MKKIIVSVLFLTAFTAAFSQEEVRVMKVKDGDTYVLKTTAKEHTIRLLNVDAPELNQHWGFNSWLNVKALILGKVVKFEVLKTDVYGRELAMVYVDGQRLDELLIANGWA